MAQHLNLTCSSESVWHSWVGHGTINCDCDSFVADIDVAADDDEHDGAFSSRASIFIGETAMVSSLLSLVLKGLGLGSRLCGDGVGFKFGVTMLESDPLFLIQLVLDG